MKTHHGNPKVLACILTVVLTAGCSENLNSIYRTVDLDDRRSPITDAKQRIITNTWASGTDGKNYPKRIICAEPSPDVAQALSSAISVAAQAEIQAQRGENTQGGSGQLGISRSTAASVAQLGERLSTIQLLRDSLYRTCEAYSNGAVSEATYALIVGRIDETMATLLAMETAAGAFGRPLAGISGSASANAGRLAGDINRLADINKQIVDLRKLQIDESEETKKTERKELIAELEEQRDGLESLVSSSSASGKVAFSGGGVAGGTGVSDTNAEQVAQIHRQFLNDDNLDGLMTACITALSKSPSHDYRGRPNYVQYEAAADIGRYGSSDTRGASGQFLPAGRPVSSQLSDTCEKLFDGNGKKGGKSLFESIVHAKLESSVEEKRLELKLQMVRAASSVVSSCAAAPDKTADVCTAAGRMFVMLGRDEPAKKARK